MVLMKRVLELLFDTDQTTDGGLFTMGDLRKFVDTADGKFVEDTVQVRLKKNANPWLLQSGSEGIYIEWVES